MNHRNKYRSQTGSLCTQFVRRRGGGCSAAALLREAMLDRVVARLVDAVAGPASRETLAAEDSTLDRLISVRCYANENDEQGEEGQASWGRHLPEAAAVAGGARTNNSAGWPG